MNKITIFCGLFLLALIVCPIVTAYDDRAVQYYNEGVDFANAGRYSESLASCDMAIAIDPGMSEAWYNRGVAQGKLGRHSEALESYDKAIAINPNDAMTWSNRGTAFGNLGRYSEAIASFDKALALNPNDAATKSNRALALERQSQAQSTPLMYAPIGAIVLMAGIAVWSRRRSI